MKVMPWSPGQVMRERTDKDVRSAAEKFFASLQNKALPAPDWEKLISFYFFKRAALEAKEYLPADYDYYKDLIDYYYPVTIGLLKRAAAILIMKFSFFLMCDLGPETDQIRVVNGGKVNI